MRWMQRLKTKLAGNKMNQTHSSGSSLLLVIKPRNSLRISNVHKHFRCAFQSVDMFRRCFSECLKISSWVEPTQSISSSRTHRSTGTWPCHLYKFLRMSASQHRTLWKEIVVESAGFNLAGTIHAMEIFSADRGDVFVWKFEDLRHAA